MSVYALLCVIVTVVMDCFPLMMIHNKMPAKPKPLYEWKPCGIEQIA